MCVCVRVTNISALEPIRSIGGRNKNIVQIVFSLYRPSSSIYLFVCFYFSFVFSLEEIRNFFGGRVIYLLRKHISYTFYNSRLHNSYQLIDKSIILIGNTLQFLLYLNRNCLSSLR